MYLLRYFLIILLAVGCTPQNTNTEQSSKQNIKKPKLVEGTSYDDSTINVLVEETLGIRKKPVKYDFVGKYYVISPSGLNFRSEPSTKSKILKALPFGKTLEVIENKSYGKDTIKEVSLFNRKEKYELPVTGYWVKTKCDGKIGFVFNSFIFKIEVNSWNFADAVNLNKDVVLLFPGEWCTEGFTFGNKSHWVGCYRVGDAFVFKNIDLGIYKIIEPENNSRRLIISANNNENLKFIIGSNGKIEEGEVTGKFVNNWWTSSGRKFKYDIATDGTIDRKALVFLQKEDKMVAFYDFVVIWKGDLDRDGAMDFIISTNHEGEESSIYLYLSSEFKNERKIKPVSAFFSGYCC